MHLDNKLDQIVWVLCAWGRCCNEVGKHLERPDSPLCDMWMMLGCEKGAFPSEIIVFWQFFGLIEFNNRLSYSSFPGESFTSTRFASYLGS